MVRRLGLWLTIIGAASGWTGCTCNKASEYNFPDAFENPDGDGNNVDPPTSVGSWLSFDSSPDGERLTMSFYDKDRTALGWAQGYPAGDGTVAWRYERVQGYPEPNGLDPANVGMYSSQKTAPDGTVWLAYHSVNTGGLNIAHRLGPNTWEVTESVDGGSGAPGVGHWASLALDAQGRPVVAHVDEAQAAVRVSRFDGENWSTVQVYRGLPFEDEDEQGLPITRPAKVGYTKLIISGEDEYLAFYDGAQGALHVMHGQGGEFTDELVDDQGDVGAWPSLLVADKELHVAYHDVGRDRLKLASWTSSDGWKIELVDGGEMRGADTAIFDKDGQLAILYSDSMNNDQWLATRTQAGGWDLEKLGGDEGAIGFHNEVVFAGGKWWTGSYDYGANSLFLKQL